MSKICVLALSKRTSSVAIMLIALFQPSVSAQTKAITFPPAKSTVTCAAAKKLAGQVDGALASNQVMQYEIHTVNVCSKELGVDHPSTLGAMSNLAVTLSDLGQFDNALALNKKTFDLRRVKLGADHPSTLESMNNLAASYGDLGQFENARALNEQTLSLRRIKLGAQHPDTMTSISNLATNYNALGQYSKAVVLHEQTLQLRRTLLGPDHLDTISSMNNLANTLVDLGQYTQALALHEQTLKARQAKLGPDHPETLKSMNNLALTYRDLGEDEKALALLDQTLRLRQSTLGRDHPDTLGSMNNLSIAYRDLKRFDKALPIIEQTLSLMRARLGNEHPDTLVAMNNLGNTLRDLNQFDKAFAMDAQTLKLRQAKLGQNHSETIRSMNNLALSHRGLAQYDQALALIPDIERGVEKLRASDLSTDNKQSIFARYSNYYQLYSLWYAENKQFAQGFDIGDLSKARTLIDSISGQVAVAALTSADRDRLSQVEATLQTAQKKQEQLIEQAKPNADSLLAVQKEVDAALTRLVLLKAELKITNPKYAQLVDLKPATVDQAKGLLADGEAFVSYLITTNGAAQAYVIDKDAQPKWIPLGGLANLSVTIAAYRDLTTTAIASTPTIAPNPSAPIAAGSVQLAVAKVPEGDLRAASRRINAGSKLVSLADGGYQWLLRGQSEPQGSAVVADTPSAALLILNKYLHDKLIAPVLPLAASYKRWIISPDKDLALLPFDTLAEGFNADGEVSKVVAQIRRVTIVQSFAVYALLKQREAEYANLRRSKELMAMGNPVYADGWSNPQSASQGDIPRDEGTRSFESKEQTSEASNVAFKPAAEQYALTRGTWKNLPGTAREVIAVAKSFGAGDKGSATVDVFTGKDASEPKMQSMQAQGTLKDYKYLLFSAHGYLAQNPSLSALVLTQQGNPEGIDGYITAAKWPSYDIRSDLTVLSACDTGVGKTQAGEGVMGLPYALFIAGNKNTLLSLWPVDDDATAEFMSRFFAKLKAGQVQPEALSQTKLEFMQHVKWSAPKYWAAFVLYGV